MDKVVFGLFVFLAALSLYRAEDEPVPVQLEIHPPGVIKQGDRVRIICKLTDPTILDLNRISKVVDNQHYAITKNNVLQAPFDSLSRYSTGETTDAVQYVEVIIDGAEGADSGDIACSKVGQETLEAVEKIHVRVPPSKVEIQYNGEAVADGSTVVVKEDEDADYACVVTVEGDDAALHVSVTLDGDDVTDRLSMSETPVIANQGGLSDNSYSATYANIQDSPSLAKKKYHNKELTCTAHTDPFDPLSEAVTISYHYGPKVVACTPKHYYTPGGEMVLSCSFTTYPPPTSVTWKWDVTSIDANGSQSDDGRYTAKATLPADDTSQEYQYTLSLSEVLQTDNLSKFTLAIEHELGNKDFEIEVEPISIETTTPESTPVVVSETQPGKSIDDGNSSAVASLSASLVFICALIMVFLH